MRDTLCSVCFAMINFVHSLPGVSRSFIVFVIVSVYFLTVRDFTKKKNQDLTKLCWPRLHDQHLSLDQIFLHGQVQVQDLCQTHIAAWKCKYFLRITLYLTTYPCGYRSNTFWATRYQSTRTNHCKHLCKKSRSTIPSKDHPVTKRTQRLYLSLWCDSATHQLRTSI